MFILIPYGLATAGLCVFGLLSLFIPPSFSHNKAEELQNSGVPLLVLLGKVLALLEAIDIKIFMGYMFVLKVLFALMPLAGIYLLYTLLKS